ncbi:hypothetical protein ASF19_23785 [Acidovorax sp. Leaf84]|nr:hypothetical protein ASF19_23785 [Acidovorax sp. Leaf84]
MLARQMHATARLQTSAIFSKPRGQRLPILGYTQFVQFSNQALELVLLSRRQVSPQPFAIGALHGVHQQGCSLHTVRTCRGHV